MRHILVMVLATFFVLSCNKVKDKTKDTINKGEDIAVRTANKGGEAIAETASGFVNGLGQGVDNAKEISIKINKDLVEKGLNTGQFVVENDSLGNENNLLKLYLIFNKDINQPILVKVLNKENVEIGRIKKEIEGKKDEAGYFDFQFDKLTNIDKKIKIVIE